MITIHVRTMVSAKQMERATSAIVLKGTKAQYVVS